MGKKTFLTLSSLSLIRRSSRWTMMYSFLTTSTCEQSSPPAACSSSLALVCLHAGLRTGAGQWLSLKRNQGPCSPCHAVAASPPQRFSSNMAAMWDHVLDLQASKQSPLFVTPRLLYESWCTENICWDIGVGLVENWPEAVLCLSVLRQEREEARLFFDYLNRLIPSKLPRLIVVKMCQVDPLHANRN